MHGKSLWISLGFVLLLSTATHAAPISSGLDDQQSVEVTVYNSNVGLVKDTRRLQLPAGQGELRFMDVASAILPFTVHVQSLEPSGGLTVLEQNYEYDLMDPNKLLDKYVGKTIKLLDVNEYQGKKETVQAQLLSNNNGQIYKINNEIHLGAPGYKILPEIPENLIAQPTLMWLYDNKTAKPQNVQVSYLTNSINWNADYIVVVNKDDNAAGLSGWVTLDNKSGATYKNAKLKLVAGEVNRVQPAMLAKGQMMMADMAMERAAAAPQFTEQSFFEYHIYDLQRPTTIKDNQTKQVSLLEADNVRIQKEFLARGNQSYFYSNFFSSGNRQVIKMPVEVYLKFKNSKENRMGMPLPAGTMRLYKEDAQKSQQFIGEDAIEHTPKDEEVELKVGEAFDVVAERVQTDFQQRPRVYETAWEVTVRNHKDAAITVGLIEPVQGDWEVTQNSHPYKKADAHTLRFDVEVPKDGEVTVKYRVQVRML